jgi:hypothetical protein
VGTPDSIVDYLPFINIDFKWLVFDEIHMIGKPEGSAMEHIIKVIPINKKEDFVVLLGQSESLISTDEEFPNELTKFRKPHQAYIANKLYPLCRSVYMINRQTRAGLGTGFVSFVAGEKGQRMMKLAGLVPATMQVRLIQITNKPLN